MSFMYGQFGTGFSRALPHPAALRFRELVETRGQEITIVRLTETGEDAYGQPLYTESIHTEKAFVEGRGGERVLMPGTLKQGDLKIFLVPWAAVKEDGYEVEVDGIRHHITALTKTRTYLQLEAVRKA